MLLLSHIMIALASVAVSTYALFSPSQTKLRVSFGLVTATLASGTYLVISTHSPMLQSCVTGLLYTGFTLGLIISASYRLSKASVDSNRT